MLNMSDIAGTELVALSVMCENGPDGGDMMTVYGFLTDISVHCVSIIGCETGVACSYDYADSDLIDGQVSSMRIITVQDEYDEKFDQLVKVRTAFVMSGMVDIIAKQVQSAVDHIPSEFSHPFRDAEEMMAQISERVLYKMYPRG